MTSLMIIHDLCDLTEVQNKIIDVLCTRLKELGDTETMKDELLEADDRYRELYEEGYLN